MRKHKDRQTQKDNGTNAQDIWTQARETLGKSEKKNIRNTQINHKIKTGTENSTNANLELGTMTEILRLGRNTVIYLN